MFYGDLETLGMACCLLVEESPWGDDCLGLVWQNDRLAACLYQFVEAF